MPSSVVRGVVLLLLLAAICYRLQMLQNHTEAVLILSDSLKEK